MALVRRQDLWDPFQELWLLSNGLLASPRRRLEEFWAPAIDVQETKDQITVKADLPGLRQEDITVSVLGTTLTITGERKHETEQKASEGQFHRIERISGTFQRVLELPSRVDAEGVKATYRDGVLTVTVPKKEEAKPNAIKVE